MTSLSHLNYHNIIDADGHVLEPPDIWEKYIDPQYRDRAIRVRSGEAKAQNILRSKGIRRSFSTSRRLRSWAGWDAPRTKC